MTSSLDPDRLAAAKEALKRGDGLSALLNLKSLLARCPQNAEAEELLGIAHAQAGNRRAALEALERATRHDPHRASAHYNYALILAQENQLDEAIQENQTALYLKPDYAQALALQENLKQKSRDRAWRSDANFAVVGKGEDPRLETDGPWANLECPVCGAKNFMTRRTCVRCGSLFPEVDPIVPVE